MKDLLGSGILFLFPTSPTAPADVVSVVIVVVLVIVVVVVNVVVFVIDVVVVIMFDVAERTLIAATDDCRGPPLLMSCC